LLVEAAKWRENLTPERSHLWSLNAFCPPLICFSFPHPAFLRADRPIIDKLREEGKKQVLMGSIKKFMKFTWISFCDNIKAMKTSEAE
jgi:hypothetical protein